MTKTSHYCSPVTSSSTDSNLSVLRAQRAFKIQENEENLRVLHSQGFFFQQCRPTATSKESLYLSLKGLKVCYTSGPKLLPGQHTQSLSWKTSKEEEAVLKLKLCVPDVNTMQTDKTEQIAAMSAGAHLSL